MPQSAPIFALRQLLNPMGFAGFIVPRSDEFQGEYVAPHGARLQWLTGFTGSAGTAIVLAKKAAIFVDGRYVIQVRQEVSEQDFQPLHMADIRPQDWLADNVQEGDRIAYDPWLLTRDSVKSYQTALEAKGAKLVAVNRNPLDAVWQDRPMDTLNPLRVHDMEFAGQSMADKLQILAADLVKKGHDAAVLTDPDAIMWALNLRGSDVEFTPIGHCFGMLDADGQFTLFVESAKVTDEVRAHLAGVNIVERSMMQASFVALRGKNVALDRVTCAQAIAQHLEGLGAKLKFEQDVTALFKAAKNPTEQAGMRAAQLRDGVAVVRFLHWLSQQSATDELALTQKLEDFRAMGAYFSGLSFPTIAGSGANGAIVHYRSNEKSNRKLQSGEFLLLDSGAQYVDGTTDITRTIAIGDVSPVMKEHFTLVLKGHIALASAVFPVGTTGTQLDVLARAPLWSRGLDFDHGTGHGVGSYLSVHEGPQGISKRPNSVALKPGMVLSNEPGFYAEGEYGIRLENLVMVQPQQVVGDRPSLGFETLTLVPFDRNSIAVELLNSAERQWLNAYHEQVKTALMPYLEPDVAEWLSVATAPI